jgi:hypothetical protein
MAKRAAPDERPYRPVDEALVRSVLSPPAVSATATAPPEAEAFPSADSVTTILLDRLPAADPAGPARNGNGSAPITEPEAAAPYGLGEPVSPAAVSSPVTGEPATATREATEAPTPTPTLEKLIREKRLLLTPSEDLDMERLVVDLTERLGTPLKLSHVLRATVTLLRRARPELLAESRRVGPLKRPYNGDGAALVAFEQSLAQIIDRSLRSTTPLE